MTQGYRPGGACRSCGTRPRKSSGSPGRSSLFLTIYHLDHGHNSSNTSCDPWPPGQLGAGRLPYRRVYICVARDKHCRLFSGTSWYLSCDNIFSIVFWRSKPGLRFLYSYSSRNSSRFSALEPDIAPETAVLRRRPPKTLLEPPTKRTTFYMLRSRKKLSKCV